MAITLAAGLGLVFMKLDAFKDVTQELIALFGLMMAGVLPTMVLTASALRAGNLSVLKLTQYRAALFAQLRIWIGLFVIALVASLLVTFGKMVAWSLPISFKLPFKFMSAASVDYDLIHVLNALITASVTIVVLRGFALGSGIMSLLQLSAEIALSEARVRDEDRFRASDDAIAKVGERPGYGAYVDLDTKH